MLLRTKAIILHNLKYRETGMILYCYSEDYGRTAFIAGSVRKSKSRFPAGYFQPLTMTEIVFYGKEGVNLLRMKDISLPYIYKTIPVNIIKSCVAIFIAEVLYRTLREEEGNPGLFFFLERSFLEFDKKEKGSANFHIYFMLHLSAFLGIFPERLLSGSKQDAEYSDIAYFGALDEKSFSAVVSMLKDEEYKFDEIKINNQERSDILDCIIKYYNLHLEGVLKLKSLPILKEVLS
jgi:DNA repair protein RecO (recombination protein O)